MAENAFKADWPSFALGFNTGKSKGGGGVELNIAYGDTPPEDTTKLWAKTTKPSRVVVAEPVHISDIPTESSVETKIKYQRTRYGVQIGTKIYRIGGGMNGIGSSIGASTVFDVETNKFEQLAGPTDYYYAAYGVRPSCAVGKKIYLFGGDSSLTNASEFFKTGPITIYDTETKEWRNCEKSLGSALGGMACEAIGTKIYLFGGVYNGTYSKNIYCFDTETESLVSAGTLPSSFAPGGSVAIGTKIYLFGGKSSAYSSRTNSYCYDIETETISSIKSLASAASNIGCCELNGVAYLFGGEKNVSGSPEYNSIIAYYPDTNTYETLDFSLPKPASGTSCAVIGEAIYLIGGLSGDKGFEVRLCTLDPQLDNGVIQILTNDGKTEVTLVTTESFTLKVPVAKVVKGNESNIGKYVAAARHNGSSWVTI